MVKIRYRFLLSSLRRWRNQTHENPEELLRSLHPPLVRGGGRHVRRIAVVNGHLDQRRIRGGLELDTVHRVLPAPIHGLGRFRESFLRCNHLMNFGARYKLPRCFFTPLLCLRRLSNTGVWSTSNCPNLLPLDFIPPAIGPFMVTLLKCGPRPATATR